MSGFKASIAATLSKGMFGTATICSGAASSVSKKGSRCHTVFTHVKTGRQPSFWFLGNVLLLFYRGFLCES